LSFSGEPMTTTQIAKAIDYNSERTGTVLARLETSGKVLRNSGGRWTGVIGAMAQPDLRAVTGRNDAPSAPQALGGRASEEGLEQPTVAPPVTNQAMIDRALSAKGPISADAATVTKLRRSSCIDALIPVAATTAANPTFGSLR